MILRSIKGDSIQVIPCQVTYFLAVQNHCRWIFVQAKTFDMHAHIHAYIPGTWWPSIYNWLFQLDDEPNLYNWEWLEITKHPFKTGCLEFHVCSIQYTYYVFERLHWPSGIITVLIALSLHGKIFSVFSLRPCHPSSKMENMTRRKTLLPAFACSRKRKKRKKCVNKKRRPHQIIADPSYHDRLVG